MSESPWQPIFQYAVEFHSTGRLEEAASLFGAILEHNPAHFPSLHRMAAIRRQQGKLEESLGLLERAIDANPGSADLRNSIANTLNGLGRREQAVSHYREALKLRESFPEANFNLGGCLKALERFEESEAAYRAALALRPDYAEAHLNLGTVLARMNRPAEAMASFSAALECDPRAKVAYNNIGMALTAMNRQEEAIGFFERAREADPQAAQPAFNQAVAYLEMGDYRRGLPGYEARWWVPELKMTAPDYAQPRWRGEDDLAGKTILLQAEQGLGDTILLARFATEVASHGAKVVAAAPRSLAPLLASVAGVAEVVSPGDALPHFDCWSPMASLPLALKIVLPAIPARVPYMTAPADAPTLRGLECDGNPLVGVCWAGSAEYKNDHNRSVPLAIFERLFRVKGPRFVSLQQKLRAGDEQILSHNRELDVESIRRENGLADTAALVARLDLVITVDTAIAHLAGALGRPVWLLLPFHSHWIWGRGRTDSPWYPTARLIRQSEIGDWASVMDRAALALDAAAPARAF